MVKEVYDEVWKPFLTEEVTAAKEQEVIVCVSMELATLNSAKSLGDVVIAKTTRQAVGNRLFGNNSVGPEVLYRNSGIDFSGYRDWF